MITEAIQEKPVEYGPRDYDGLWKRIIADLFEDFILFFASDLYEEIDFNQEPDFLQQELFKEIIQGKKGRNVADQIVKVSLKSGEDKWILIHIEVQGEDSIDFSDRMFRYFYRIYDKYNKKVYAIALMTDDKESGYPSYFHYDFFGTKVDYKYNVYKFHDHAIDELEQSDNPFAVAIIAGKYANKYKKDVDKRFYFKRKLMMKILRGYSQDEEKPRIYITALFYFIDYLLRTPTEYEQELRSEITKFIKKDGGEQMHAEKEVLSPTLAAVLKMLEQEEIAKAKEEGIEKGKSEGSKEAKINFAKKLIKEDFENKKIAELTGLGLEDVMKIKKLLQD